ncbi:Uncharacterised protein [Moraxella lacunata]|uniref:Restriction endonuclease subunit M n=1 Tax=Moraxella lacunata TaxID=477 RepID=A0A378QJ60_MORLA|nr:restriction endonuclease subunit M [Moraxella lacunata]STZ00929.1 Uncharacterised protein [Moraxella lacunata]
MTDTAQKQTNTKQVKSKKRVADFGEVFTAEREVNAMLGLLPDTIWHNITATFLEPACGNGNFLAEILSRKLNAVLELLSAKKIKKKHQAFNYGFYAIGAVSSIYGIEILADNCIECRERLLKLFIEHYQTHFKDADQNIIKVVNYLLNQNIVNGDALFNAPIVFSEWAFVGEMVYRTDYIYQNMVDDKHYRTEHHLHKKYKSVHYLELNESTQWKI